MSASSCRCATRRPGSEESLGAVLSQDYPSDLLEIVLVDGESDDGTIDIACALPGADRVTILHNPSRNQAAGLNIGIRHSRGEIIVRVDGHTIVALDYVSQCVSALKSTGSQGVGGLMRPLGVTSTGKTIATATTSRFAVPSAFHVSEAARYTDTVYMGAWPKTVLEQVGEFDQRMVPNEDYELHYRIRQLGGRLYLTPAITSRYICRQSLGGLMRQYYAYGKGKVQTLRKHPRSLRLRQLAAPGLVLCLLAGLALSLFSSVIFWTWLAVISLYGVLCLGFSVQMAGRRLRANPGQLWRLPLVFFTIHISWGAGFWGECLTGANLRSLHLTRWSPIRWWRRERRSPAEVCMRAACRVCCRDELACVLARVLARREQHR